MRRLLLFVAICAASVASVASAQRVLRGFSPATPYAAQGVFTTNGCASMPNGDVVCYDNNGVIGGQYSSGTTDPDGLMIRAQACNPGDATCTAANVYVWGGQDTTGIAIDGANPSVSCAGDNDTVTVCAWVGTTGLCEGGGTTGVVLTEGTEWTATASVADTCASLATGINAHANLTGVEAECVSPNVELLMNGATGAITLAESTPGCTTVAMGTRGTINHDGPLSFKVNGAEYGSMSAAGLWAFRPVSPPSFHFQVGSTGTSFLSVDTPNNVVIVNTGGSIGLNVWTETVKFCGQGPNGATTVYLSPTVAGVFGDATCDAEDDTTEATADEVYWPYAVRAMTMHCGLTDAAADTGVTFALRDDTADASADLTCTTAALDGAGYAECYDQDLSPPTIAAGSAIAMRVVAASGNLTAADIWCTVLVSR